MSIPSVTRTHRIDRFLRICAGLSVLVTILFVITLEAGPRATPYFGSDFADPTTLSFFALWLPLLEQASYQFALGVGVAALVSAVWRRERTWSLALLLVLLAVVFGPMVANYFALLERLVPALANSYDGEVLVLVAGVPTLLPLLALLYARGHGLAGPDPALDLEVEPISAPAPRNPESFGF